MSEAGAQSKQGGARVRLPPPLAYLGSIALGVALQRWVLPLSTSIPRPLRLALGLLFLGGAVALAAPAIRRFKRTGQDPAPWRPSPTLVLAGPYRYTRNPMYLGMTVLQLGLGVTLDNAWVVLLAPLSLLLVHFTAVLPEERYLTDRFGEDYQRYQSRVRRYL